jgi:hypothetical protein
VPSPEWLTSSAKKDEGVAVGKISSKDINKNIITYQNNLQIWSSRCQQSTERDEKHISLLLPFMNLINQNMRHALKRRITVQPT